MALKRLWLTLLPMENGSMRSSAARHINQDGRSNTLTAPSGLDATGCSPGCTPQCAGSGLRVFRTWRLMEREQRSATRSKWRRWPRSWESRTGSSPVRPGRGEVELRPPGSCGRRNRPASRRCWPLQRAIPANCTSGAESAHLVGRHPFSLAAETRPWPRGAIAHDSPAPAPSGSAERTPHIVLEEAPRLPARTTPPPDGDRVLLVPARTPAALTDAARQYGEFLKTRGSTPLYDICHASVVQRGHYEEPVAVITGPRTWRCARPSTNFSCTVPPNMAAGRASGKAESLVFVARSGIAMVRHGNLSCPRRAGIPRRHRRVRGVDPALGRVVALIEQLAAPEAESKLADTEYGQPAIFSDPGGAGAPVRVLGPEA